MMSDTDIKDRIRSAMFSGMSMSLRDDLCEMLDDLWFETATQAAALTDAEATIAALTQANASLAQDNARLAKRVEALRAIADLAEISGVEFDRKHPELAKLLDDAGVENWGTVIAEFASSAWLAGGDA